MSTEVNWPLIAESRFARLAAITGITIEQWKDACTLSPPDQEDFFRGMMALGKMSWNTDPDVWPEVLKLLQTIGTIAGVVSGVAGAALALAALRGL